MIHFVMIANMVGEKFCKQYIYLTNHILLLFKLYIYKSRNKDRLNINELLANIPNIKKLQKVTASGNAKRLAGNNKKWDITNRKLPL